MLKINSKWFTLVELIVVVLILTILSVIGFISFEKYTVSARDANRIAQLDNIKSWLNKILLEGRLPIATDKIDIKSWTDIIAYHWFAWKSVLEKIGYSEKWIDPKDETYFTYYVSSNRKYFQLLTYLEEDNEKFEVSWLIKKSYAINYTKRIPYVVWKKLWILVWINNEPLSDLVSNELDISDVGNLELKAYLTNDEYSIWSWKNFYRLAHMAEIWWKWFFVDKNGLINYKSLNWLTTCPIWYILVPWNEWFNTNDFCVAQYEMSWHWITWSTDSWNSYSYTDNWDKWDVVSEPWNSPIWHITQIDAMKECNSLWNWYHLITNDERMTIARNIEWNPKNWSWKKVWDGFIYNWVSNNTTMWCDWNLNTKPVDWNRWTVTWDDICFWRNKLFLDNWQAIWDFAWNFFEHVNWTNDTNYVDWNIYNNKACSQAAWRYSWFGNDWNEECDYTDLYDRSEIWPLWDYNWDNGMWRLYSDTRLNQVFIRSWGASYGETAWIYTLALYRDDVDIRVRLWFRCAKN